MDIRPFRGWRPRPDLADRIPSYPYDVVNSDEARELAQGDPDTFLHVVKPEIDLDPGIDPYDDRVYARARENLRGMMADGRLIQDSQPAYYVYRMTMGAHEQTGVVAASAVDDYVEGRIRKHEFTRPEKEDDRVRHMEAVGAHTGPVLLTFHGTPEIERWVEEAVASDPSARFVAPDGVGHVLWVVEDPARVEQLRSLFGALSCTYIADGHHRAASAGRVAKTRDRAGQFLTILFPSDRMQILEYNRLVRDLAGLSADEFLDRASEAGFDLSDPGDDREAGGPGHFLAYVGDDRWVRMIAREKVVPEDPVARLDVAVLADRLLGPVLGVGDPRTDPRLEFVGGIRGWQEIQRRVDDGDHAVGFVMHPTAIEDVMRVADAGEVMPPKSTWFEPKARSGMVVHDFED